MLIKTAQTWSIQIEVYNLLCSLIFQPSCNQIVEAKKARDQGYVLPSYSNHWLGRCERVTNIFVVMLYQAQLNILDRGLQLSAEY